MTYTANGRYFGRNLDLAYTNNERAVIMPRGFPLRMNDLNDVNRHYAVIGTGIIAGGFPLYYDAANEKGLCIAALNFPGEAVYRQYERGMKNIAPFEFIPYVLSRCADISEVKELLERVNITDTAFAPEYPSQPLHWMIDGPDGTVAAEPRSGGLRVYANPAGVLTNSPGFDFHMTNLRGYAGLSAGTRKGSFGEKLGLSAGSLGDGCMGMPGDMSSASRFVRAAFMRNSSVSGKTEEEGVSQLFAVLDSVKVPRGSVVTENGGYEITQYSSCCSADRGKYYHRTYNSGKTVVTDMYREDLDGNGLISYPIS